MFKRFIEKLIWKYIGKHEDFQSEILTILTDDCPYYEVCGEDYLENVGQDYYDSRGDPYD